MEIACDEALCSASGAATHTSPRLSIAATRACRPSAMKPSSLETRMRAGAWGSLIRRAGDHSTRERPRNVLRFARVHPFNADMIRPAEAGAHAEEDPDGQRPPRFPEGR